MLEILNGEDEAPAVHQGVRLLETLSGEDEASAVCLGVAYLGHVPDVGTCTICVFILRLDNVVLLHQHS